PSFEVRDHRVRKLFLWRHLKLFVFITDGFDELALVHVTRNNARRTRFPAAQQARGGVHFQIAFELLGLLAVARIALIDKDGPDFGFEEFELLSLCGGVISAREPDNGEQEKTNR